MCRCLANVTKADNAGGEFAAHSLTICCGHAGPTCASCLTAPHLSDFCTTRRSFARLRMQRGRAVWHYEPSQGRRWSMVKVLGRATLMAMVASISVGAATALQPDDASTVVFKLTPDQWRSMCPMTVSDDGVVVPGLRLQIIDRPALRYPFDELKNDEEGAVLFRLRIDAAGIVADLELVSATHPGFVKSAASTVRRWRYEPPTVNGRPTCVETKVEVSYHFE
jgi:TonB family protein